jgi:hypothetical protein
MRPRFHRTRTTGLGALLISAAIIPFSGPAEAGGLVDDPGAFGGDPQQASIYCHQYAQEAAKDARINQQHGCYPRNDPRWNTDENAHYDYCAYHETDISFLQYEKAIRQTQADNCSFCNSNEFAVKSGNRVLDNKLFSCNLPAPPAASDGRFWSDDPHVQVNACLYTYQDDSTGPLRLGPISSRAIESDLQGQVDQCKARTDPRIAGFCENYATQAYQLATYYPQDIMNSCTAGQEPSRWSKDWQFHFKWCMNPSSANFAAEEQNTRMTTIRQCAVAHGFATPSSSDPAFTPAISFGGGFASKSLQSPGQPATPRYVPPFSQSTNSPIGTDRITAIPGRPDGGGFDTSRSVPSLSQPANTPIGTNRIVPIPGGPGGGGFDTSRSVPSFSQPANTPIGTNRIVPIPGGPGGGGPGTSKSGGPDYVHPIPTVVNKDVGTTKPSSSASTSTGGAYQVHPGGTSANSPTGFSVKTDQPMKFGKHASAAAGFLRGNRPPSFRATVLHSYNPAIRWSRMNRSAAVPLR